MRLKFLGDKSKESEYATQILTSQAQFRDINTLVGGEDTLESGNTESGNNGESGPVNP